MLSQRQHERCARHGAAERTGPVPRRCCHLRRVPPMLGARRPNSEAARNGATRVEDFVWSTGPSYGWRTKEDTETQRLNAVARARHAPSAPRTASRAPPMSPGRPGRTTAPRRSSCRRNRCDLHTRPLPAPPCSARATTCLHRRTHRGTRSACDTKSPDPLRTLRTGLAASPAPGAHARPTSANADAPHYSPPCLRTPPSPQEGDGTAAPRRVVLDLGLQHRRSKHESQSRFLAP